MSSTLIIDDKRDLTWMPSGGVFDFTVDRMGELMKEKRPDLSTMFLDANSDRQGWCYLDIDPLPLEDKKYVLEILVELRKCLAKEHESGPTSYDYHRLDLRLADFEELLRKSVAD